MGVGAAPPAHDERVPRALTNGRTRILIAMKQKEARRALGAMLEGLPQNELVAMAETGQEAVARAIETRPRVAVLDLDLPETGGLEATRKIRAALPSIQVLILTPVESEQMACSVLQGGAHGCVLKCQAERELAPAVESLAHGRPFFSTSLAQTILNGYVQLRSPPADEAFTLKLSARELSILRLLAEGCTNKEIATRQAIAVKTAETHRANIMRKLKVHSISDLVRLAVRHRVICA